MHYKHIGKNIIVINKHLASLNLQQFFLEIAGQYFLRHFFLKQYFFETKLNLFFSIEGNNLNVLLD